MKPSVDLLCVVPFFFMFHKTNSFEDHEAERDPMISDGQPFGYFRAPLARLTWSENFDSVLRPFESVAVSFGNTVAHQEHRAGMKDDEPAPHVGAAPPVRIFRRSESREDSSFLPLLNRVRQALTTKRVRQRPVLRGGGVWSMFDRADSDRDTVSLVEADSDDGEAVAVNDVIPYQPAKTTKLCYLNPVSCFGRFGRRGR